MQKKLRSEKSGDVDLQGACGSLDSEGSRGSRLPFPQEATPETICGLVDGEPGALEMKRHAFISIPRRSGFARQDDPSFDDEGVLHAGFGHSIKGKVGEFEQPFLDRQGQVAQDNSFLPSLLFQELQLEHGGVVGLIAYEEMPVPVGDVASCSGSDDTALPLLALLLLVFFPLPYLAEKEKA